MGSWVQLRSWVVLASSMALVGFVLGSVFGRYGRRHSYFLVLYDDRGKPFAVGYDYPDRMRVRGPDGCRDGALG